MNPPLHPKAQLPQRIARRPPFLILLFVAASALLSSMIESSNASQTPSIADWPDQWKGHWLEPMPLTRLERKYAQSFPGQIATFQAGEQRILMKRIVRPTRKVHSLKDCLRASGYAITKENEGSFLATKERETLSIQEVVYEKQIGSTECWHDVSKWYWHAVREKKNAPWYYVAEVSQ